MPKCDVCPRECGVDRLSGKLGFCRAPEDFLVAKTMIHKWEEPCIAGECGAGTIFFSGCNLRCVFCQNMQISRGETGEIYSAEKLKDAIFSLIADGAECVEFVTPSHYIDSLAMLLKEIKPKISVPVVFNSGGYEGADSLKLLDGLVDVYMPDFKYFDSVIAEKYSSAPNYCEIATDAISEMLRQVGIPEFDEKGKLLRGVIIRHLVLPSHRADSIAVLRHISEKFGADAVILSLMSQYTPDFYIESGDERYKNLCRRVTKFEYDSVMKIADELGFDGYFQGMSAASKSFTPNFSETQG